MEITDKELLAICNLSNLKMEFADVVAERDLKGKILSNHTIYSLLEKEKEAILKDKNTKKERGFFKDLGSNETEETVNKDKIIYEKIEDLQKEAGVVYEYFEKLNNLLKIQKNKDKFLKENEQYSGSFTNEWEILGTYDGYKLIKMYYDYLEHEALKGIIYEYNKDDIIFIYDENSQIKVLPIKNKNNILEIREANTFEKKIYINEKISQEDINICPSREKLKEYKDNQVKLNQTINFISIASVLIPTIGDLTRTAFLNNKNVIKELFFSMKIHHKKIYNDLIKSLTENFWSANILNNISASIKTGVNFKDNIQDIIIKGVVELSEEISKVQGSTTPILAKLLIDLPSFTYNLLNEIVNYKKQKKTSEILSFQEEEILNKRIKELEIILEDLNSQKEFIMNEYLNIFNEGFGITILKKEKNIVICFKNPPENSETRKNIVDKNVLCEIMLLKIFQNMVIPKLYEELKIENKNDYTIIITGFDYGSDLSDLYYATENLIEILGFKKEIRTFKSNVNNLLNRLMIFEKKDLALFYQLSAKDLKTILIEEINFFNVADITYFTVSIFFCVGGGVLYLVGNLIMKLLFTLGTRIKELKNYQKIDFLYKILEKADIFEKNNTVLKIKENYETILTTNYTQVPLRKIFESNDFEIDFSTSNYYTPYKIELLYSDYLALIIDFFLLGENQKIISEGSFYKESSVMERIINYIPGISKEYFPIEEFNNKKEMEKIYELILKEKEKIVTNLLILSDSLGTTPKENISLFSNKPIKENEKLKEGISIVESYLFHYKFKNNFENKYLIEKYRLKIRKYQTPFFLQKKYFLEEKILRVGFKNKNILYTKKISELHKIETPFKKLSWFLNLYISYNKISSKFEGEYFMDNLTKIKKFNYKNFIKSCYQPKGLSYLNEFSFLPYIDDNGNLKTRGNGETSYLDINDNYIGSVFRNIIEDLQANSINDINFPKFYNEKIDDEKSEPKENSLVLKIGDTYSKKLSSKSDTLDTYFNYERGKYLNLEFIKKFNEYLDKLNKSRETKGGIAFYMTNNSGLYKGYNSLEEVIKKIKTKPEILEKFYVFSNSKENPLIKELRIGHLNGYEHNPNIFEYVYNTKDDMKKGILIIKVGIPKCLEDSFKENANKTQLLNKATLICTAGGEPKKFIVTSNNSFKIQNLAVGLSSDKIGGKNIPAFGSCTFKKEGCQCPVISGEWTNQSEALLVNSQKILTVGSTIKCEVGGTILVQKNGTEITNKSIIK